VNNVAEIESLFGGLGASFLLPGAEIQRRLAGVQAFVFDWDGVFNRGDKGEGSFSTFSEPDSMGANLLRYAYWRARGRLPVCAVVSGAHNETALAFAKRERFDAVFCGVRDKAIAFDMLTKDHSLRRDEMVYVFDDANDFSVAQDCALRFLVRREASPLLREFAVTNALADYITAAKSGEYAVREVSELLLGMLGGYPDVFESRQRYDSRYQDYFAARQAVRTNVFDAD
jgi:3-deoxy-D-manno-octulosonate 8-phosphate phosphatase (KDO 8-P phosphatase)